jgi:hypothetical protein
MSIEKEVPLITKEGYNYLISFSKFPTENLPKLTIPVVDLTISVENNVGVNNSATLLQITSIIKEYLNENDVVLYCYCDDKEVNKSKNKENITPQEYRSKLFSAMFEKEADANFINSRIIITGDTVHYIHLIAKKKNSAHIDLISNELLKLQK